MENPNRQESSLIAYHASGASFGNKSKTGLPAWNRGLPGTFTGKHHSDATRQQMSISRHKLYDSGWESVAGRCKKFDYHSPIAGNVKVDGTWELIFARWLDFKGFNWRRNKERFPYINLKGIESHYTPDFWVEELDGYVEIKGYETELDRCKWSQFPHSLKKIFKEDIQKIQSELNE